MKPITSDQVNFERNIEDPFIKDVVPFSLAKSPTFLKMVKHLNLKNHSEDPCNILCQLEKKEETSRNGFVNMFGRIKVGSSNSWNGPDNRHV